MTQGLIKSNLKTQEWDEAKTELSDMLARYGWKWAVMASTAGKLHRRGEVIPNDVLHKIRMSKTQIESGCYSVCDIATSIREIETEIFSALIKAGPQETDSFLELTGKAISGKITEADLDLKGASPILADCLTLPCVCNNQ